MRGVIDSCFFYSRVTAALAIIKEKPVVDFWESTSPQSESNQLITDLVGLSDWDHSYVNP